MSHKVYAIIDLNGYVTQMREVAAKSLSDSTEDNLDDFISVGQMINMVNDECLGFDDEDRPLLNEVANERIFENTAVWIHNVGLAKLAAQNLIECAWDDKDNDMIFWLKEKAETNNGSKSRKQNMGDQK